MLSNEGALWRVDLETGERTQVLARMSVFWQEVDTDTYLMKFYLPPIGESRPLFDLEYVATANHTLVAGSVSEAVDVPGEGVLYLDAHGAEPGVWAAPLP